MEGVNEIYTYDGNVLKKGGEMSTHGNPDAIKRSQKFNNNITKLYQEI